MRHTIFALMLLTGCNDFRGGGTNLEPVRIPMRPEDVGIDATVLDRLQEKFDGPLSVTDLGEFAGGEHYQVKHSGEIFIVVYDLEQNQIVSISKAGTKGEQP